MVNPIDTRPQGDPETVVLLPDGESLVGLYVRGLKDGKAMLGIREDQFGRPISCSVTDEIWIDTSVRKMNMDLLRGPVREDSDTGED